MITFNTIGNGGCVCCAPFTDCTACVSGLPSTLYLSFSATSVAYHLPFGPFSGNLTLPSSIALIKTVPPGGLFGCTSGTVWKSACTLVETTNNLYWAMAVVCCTSGPGNPWILGYYDPITSGGEFGGDSTQQPFNNSYTCSPLAVIFNLQTSGTPLIVVTTNSGCNSSGNYTCSIDAPLTATLTT